MRPGRGRGSADDGAPVEWLDLGRGPDATRISQTASRSTAPTLRLIVAAVVALLALLGAYALGRSSEPPGIAAPVLPTPTPLPTLTPVPSATPPPPTPTPVVLTDLLGQGEVVERLELADGTEALIWCRENVPGTRIPPTLALLHVQSAFQFGDQLVSYEELTIPWVPTGASWRGQVDTEGFGSGGDVIGGEALVLDGSEPEGTPGDGTRCDSCTPSRAQLPGGEVLFGSCQHGVPFRAGISYVVASPSVPGQTPLALHLDCGITSIALTEDGAGFVVGAEVPLVQGLTDARFRLPSVTITLNDGRFWADDLGLLDWACAVDRSTQLGDRHLLRTDAEPRLTYQVVESDLGRIGVHGPLVIGLDRDQCSALTRAWWGVPTTEREGLTPIADVVGLAPPEGEPDWVYTCQPE
ncbi:MAG: hypothetical protein AAF567_08150 [Actinomycetota bacterium]